MSKQNSWKRLFLGGVAATAVVAGIAAFTLTPSVASAQDAPADAPAAEESGRRFARGGERGDRDGMMGGAMMQRGAKGEDQAQYLADALGISAEELDAAQEEAKAAALALAVEEGLITQEEADQMADGEGRGKRGGAFGARGHAGQDADIDHEALLADALGISVDELDVAKEAARDAALDAALEAGDITQEQVDRMEAREALKDYIDHEAIMAEVLGLTVEELQTAREEGTLKELVESLDLDRATMQEAMQAANEQAIADAVADGVITQEQAELLQDGEGFGGRGGFSGPGGPGGPGGERGGRGR